MLVYNAGLCIHVPLVSLSSLVLCIYAHLRTPCPPSVKFIVVDIPDPRKKIHNMLNSL